MKQFSAATLQAQMQHSARTEPCTESKHSVCSNTHDKVASFTNCRLCACPNLYLCPRLCWAHDLLLHRTVMTGQYRAWDRRQSKHNDKMYLSACFRSPARQVVLRSRRAQPQQCLTRDPDSVSSHSCTRKGFMLSTVSVLTSAIDLGSPGGADALSCQGMRPYELQQCLKEKRAAQEEEVCSGVC